jgi:hypothetical protein
VRNISISDGLKYPWKTKRVKIVLVSTMSVMHNIRQVFKHLQCHPLVLQKAGGQNFSSLTGFGNSNAIILEMFFVRKGTTVFYPFFILLLPLLDIPQQYIIVQIIFFRRHIYSRVLEGYKLLKNRECQFDRPPMLIQTTGDVIWERVVEEKKEKR